jgi:hypothetical protein
VPFPLTYVVIDQRNEIIKELKKYSKRKKFVLDKKQIDSVWIRIESALADYRGKSNDSPTPTIKVRNKRVKMARSLATELIDTLGFYDDPHIFGFINRHMMLIGGEALELKKQGAVPDN